MKWLENFMRGRNGADQLSFAILILYFIITIIASLFRIPYLNYVTIILMVWCFFRMFSKNRAKRAQENAIFMGKIYPIQNAWRTKRKEWRERKTHKFFSCPNCKQRLRVPKGKGKITITCPKCKTKFDKRT